MQRVLAAHPQVATTAEPWVLLPMFYALRDRGAVAGYGHGPAARAIREFIGTLPAGEDDYLQALRAFAMDLYKRSSSQASGAGVEGSGVATSSAVPARAYFLDKTPRYHLIAEDLFRAFPDAEFVFLWRNPLAVLASIVETWAGGTWSIGRWRVDLFDGVANLTGTFRAHADQAVAVRYEDLVAPDSHGWNRLFAHLGMAFDPSFLSRLPAEHPSGRMGDPTGTRAYEGLSTAPLAKWKRTLANPFRKRWAADYLRWIGKDRLGLMGYDVNELLAELDAIRSTPSRLGSDLTRSAYGSWKGRRRDSAFRMLSGPGRW